MVHHAVKYFITIFIILINAVRKINTSVIRQKGEAQNGCFKKRKQAKFSEKEHFWPLCCYQGVKNVRFSENLVCFVLLKHPF